MKVSQIISLHESAPHWKHNEATRTYTVYDSDGNEVENYTYKDPFNRSSEYNAAVRKVKELEIQAKHAEREKQERKDAEKPLSDVEKMYVGYHQKWKRMFSRLKMLDPETQEVTYTHMDKLMDKMKNMQIVVRKDIIMNTEKYYDQV